MRQVQREWLTDSIAKLPAVWLTSLLHSSKASCELIELRPFRGAIRSWGSLQMRTRRSRTQATASEPAGVSSRTQQQ